MGGFYVQAGPKQLGQTPKSLPVIPTGIPPDSRFCWLGNEGSIPLGREKKPARNGNRPDSGVPGAAAGGGLRGLHRPRRRGRVDGASASARGVRPAG